MKKRFVAFLLVLIMVLGMLPVSAFAADDGVSPQALNTGHKIDVTFTVLYVGDEFRIGYNYGTSENTQFVCQYSTNHSDTAYNNHTIAISDIKAAADRATVNSGYQIVGWSKEANANPKTWGFDLKDPTACNKGTTIYLVAKNPNPNPTYMYYLYYKYNDGTNSTWLTEVPDRPTTATTFTFHVNTAKLKDRRGYEHIGWADKADAAAAKYTGGEPITLTKDDPAKTIYAVWMPIFELRYDANGGTGAPDSQTRTASHPTVNQVTFTVPNQTPTKEGYTFKGWADSATATDAQYQPGGTVAVKHADSPKTVYAVWEESAPQPPLIPVPSYDDLKSAIGKIQVKDVSTPGCGTENYDLIDNTQSEPFNWTKTARLDQPGKYDVTIKTAPYVAKYNSEKTKTHELNNANQTTLRLVISYENSKWVLDDGLRVIEVKHSEQTPPTDKPDKPTALDGSFAIVCKNNEATHAHKADYIATPSQYTISDVQTDEQGYYVTATVTVAPNLVAYNTLTGAEHRLVNEQDATLTITFRYDTEVTVDENRKWTQQGEVPVVEVICEPKAPTDDENGYQLSGNLNLATVMFEANGENVTGMPAVNYTYDDILEIHDFYFTGDTFTLPADPTREGYSFEGWSVKVLPAENDADHLDADGADDAADETLLKAGDTYTITAGGVKFTAQWKKKTFTVKYYLPDETGTWVEKKMDTVDSVDYATYSLWTPNAEDGYEFSGWYQKTADIGVKAKVEKLYMAKEWKLYGKFTPIEYTIQYVYNDGKATSTNPTTYTVESDTITLADATGADWGKTFLEWHDENGQKITEIPTGSTGDRVITAYWNWPVHLHYLDKDNNEIESATLYVSELEPGACVLPTGEKTGYDFDGWYEAQKDIGTASHKLNALSIAKKWELYGRYTAKTDVSYTVKYLREGDNKVLAPEKVVTDQTFDTEVTEQAADVVGYTPDAPSKTMILDEYNKVLTFSYSANTYRYEIHYFLQEPDGSYMEKEVDTTPTGVFDTTVTITPDPNRYGAHYSYNSVKSVVSGVVTVDDPATILKLNVYYDLDFHTLTFDTMGGSTIDPVTVRHGNAVARPADPTKDKYTFIGWYADPEFSAEYDFATVLEADKTIYAKFELTSTPIGDIYVRYDVLHIKQLPDGSYDLANAEVEHLSAKKDTTVTAVVKDYRATHHINVNSTLSKLTDTAIQPYPGADGKPVYTILSVYYDLDFHTLTFDTMGGSRIDPVTVRHGNAVAKPKDPVNGGYIFDGWYTDKTYRTPYNFATVLTQDTTIYAKWFLITLPGVTVKKATPKLNTSDHFAYVQGYPDGTVKPTGNITRAETAAILFRLMDEGSRKTYYSTKSGFRDVATGSWYNTYVATLNNAGVITDSSNGYFRPNEAITRAELAAMLANFTETAGAANYFNDVSARYWAANAIAICAKLGWITGYPDGSFRPDRNVTRAELMAMINRATGRAPKSADAFLPGMKTWSDNTADKWYYLDVQEATNSHSYTVKDSEKWTALNADPNWSLYE